MGKVQAATTPLAGAVVKLYAAGIAGNGSAPTQLLAAALSTDTNGAFQVAGGSYDCPSTSTVLYLVSQGGQIGTQSPNSAATLMAVLGTCGNLGSTATTVVNEVSTVAAAFVARPFLSAGGQLGSTATNVGGLALSVGTIGSLIDITKGQAPGPGFPANGTAPTGKLNTLANLLDSCVMATSASSTACTSLFSLAGGAGVPPTNTLDAALDIASQPGTNVPALFALADMNQVFQPTLGTVPGDWMLAVPFTGGGMNAPTAVSLDSAGRVWVANYFGVASLFTNTGAPAQAAGFTGNGLNESYGGAVDATDRMWIANQQSDAAVNGGYGSITVLNASGPALAGNSQLTNGGLNFPTSVGFDRNGNAWVVDYGNSRVTVLSAAGTPLSGSAGYVSDQFAFPVAVAVDSQGNGWVANESGSTLTRIAADGSAFQSYTVGDQPAAVAVDAGDNIWSANYYGDSLGLISAAGQVVSNGGYTGGGLSHPTGLATDGAGTAWVANYRGPGISALAGATSTNPGAPLSPAAGWGSDQKLLEAFGIAVDAAGNVWVSSYGDSRLVEFVGVATPVRTPLLGGTRVP